MIKHGIMGQRHQIGAKVVDVDGVQRAVRQAGEQIFGAIDAPDTTAGFNSPGKSGHHLASGYQAGGAAPCLFQIAKQDLLLPPAGEVPVQAGQPALGVIQVVPAFIQVDLRIGVGLPGQTGPQGEVLSRFCGISPHL